MNSIPTDVEMVMAMPDTQAVLRNLLITQRYHEISACLCDLLGDANVNWPTFATWASKTAGRTIRNEEVPVFVHDLVALSHHEARPHLEKIGDLLPLLMAGARLPAAVLLAPIVITLRDVSDSIARGNLKVFAELAPEFVRFVRTFRADDARDDLKLKAYLSDLKPGPTDEGGQDYLAAALTAYFRAAHEADPIMRARFVYLGNCLIGLHEQARLQPEIKAALDAPVHDALHLYLRKTGSAAGGDDRFDQVLESISYPLSALQAILAPIWEQVATRYLMSLALPGGGNLPLGRDIPLSAAVRDALPAELLDVDNPQDLVMMLRRFDRLHGGGTSTAATNWAVIEDRMHFIVHLFRSSQQDRELFAPPFSREQTASIEARLLPAGVM